MKHDVSTLTETRPLRLELAPNSRLRQGPLLFLFLMSLLSLYPMTALHAQQQVVGHVIDAASKESIPGANILIKESTIGTVTDLEGRFNMEVSGPDAILIVSFRSEERRVGKEGR